MVLHTDNAGHFPMVGALEEALDAREDAREESSSGGTEAGAGAGAGAGGGYCLEPGSAEEALFLGATLHAFDISNPARDWTLNTRWTDLVTAEFWLQGDQERRSELTVGPMNDREGPVPKPRSSSGFATALVLPLYRALHRFDGLDISVPFAQLELNNRRAQGLVGSEGRPDVASPTEEESESESEREEEDSVTATGARKEGNLNLMGKSADASTGSGAITPSQGIRLGESLPAPQPLGVKSQVEHALPDPAVSGGKDAGISGAEAPAPAGAPTVASLPGSPPEGGA